MCKGELSKMIGESENAISNSYRPAFKAQACPSHNRDQRRSVVPRTEVVYVDSLPRREGLNRV
jgi:hypothetical protein